MMDTDAQTSADDVRSETGDLEAKLAAAEKLAEERYLELQYARADVENARKRAVRSADERLVSGRKNLLGKFLPVLDNLRRAMAFEDGDGLRGGLNGTLKGFEALLASEQIVPIEVVGKPFDPHVAEAIATRETPDHEDDVVLEEAQRGYRLGEELLRPAMVVVAKKIDTV